MARFQLSILALVSCIAQISAQCTASEWSQCGGINYTGCTTCASGLTCTQWNPYYYQCIAATTTVSSTSTSRSSSSSTTTRTSTTTTSTTTRPPSSTTTSTTTRTSTTSTATSSNTLPVIPLSPTGLASYAKSKGKYIGSAYDNAYISDSAYNKIVLENVNQLTCENSMKWDSVEQTQGDFSTTLWADRVVNITILNSMTLRGHTLVWHSQLPSWVTGGSWTNATLQSVMINHITGEMSKYKGKIHTWDVVNEALNEDGSLRTSLFYNLIGETYIDIAFKTAKTVDSAAILAINDYNIDGTGSKSTGMTNLVTRVKARGAPIEQIGIQAHLIVGSVPTTISTNWNNFANLGVSIAITELDIRMPTPATTANLAQQATDYVNVVTACLNISKCLGITFWGMSDAHSWVSSTFSGQGAACLYDESMQPKAAYTAVQSLLAS